MVSWRASPVTLGQRSLSSPFHPTFRVLSARCRLRPLLIGSCALSLLSAVFPLPLLLRLHKPFLHPRFRRSRTPPPYSRLRSPHLFARDPSCSHRALLLSATCTLPCRRFMS